MIAEGDAAPAATAPQTSVGMMTVELASDYTVTHRFTGQVEAAARTELGFEFGGRVTETLVEEGDLVPKGAALARLDTSALIPQSAALEAELAALAADAELARLTLARNDALTERGFRSVAAQDDARLTLACAEAGMAAGLAVGGTVTVALDAALMEATLHQIRPDLDPNTRSRSVVLALPADTTTVGGFLPLIVGGGGFWPPFAMSVAGGVALSMTLAFAFTPQMFALTLSPHARGAAPDVTLTTDIPTLRFAGD
jgi:hypothetical protein